MKSRLQTLMLASSLAIGSLVATSTTTLGQDVKVPETVADHVALAKQYSEKAATYRAEAEHHRKMAAAYKAKVASSPKAPENPWARKMEKHCMALVKDAEKLAADAQKAAEFHTLRAKELEGK